MNNFTKGNYLPLLVNTGGKDRKVRKRIQILLD